MANKKNKTDKILKVVDQQADLEMMEETQTKRSSPELQSQPDMPEPAPQKMSSSSVKPSLTSAASPAFPGRDYLSSRFPESIALLDRVASEWVHDGNFDFLPIPNKKAKSLIVGGFNWARSLESRIVKKQILPKVEKFKSFVKPYMRG